MKKLDKQKINELIKQHKKTYGYIHVTRDGRSFHTFNKSKRDYDYVLIFQFDIEKKLFRIDLIDFSTLIIEV